MLTQIRLKNFKCFKNETAFPLGRINLLTGVNGRGKSSLLQAMLLFRQSIEHNSGSNTIILNGSCIQLGSFEDVKNSENPTDMPIEMAFSCNMFDLEKTSKGNIKTDNSKFKDVILEVIIPFEVNSNSPRMLQPIDLTVRASNAYLSIFLGKDNPISNIKKLQLKFEPLKYGGWKYSVSDDEKDNKDIPSGASFSSFNFFPRESIKPFLLDGIALPMSYISYWFPFNRIHYIAADRIGPQTSYDQENLDSFVNTGPTGRNTATILNLLGDKKIVHNNLYLGKDAQTLLQQTEEWLNYIFDGAKITITLSGDNINIAYNTNSKGYRYRPTNVGFGYSYILPIIVSGLIAEEDETLIVENPEAHLHPRAQNRLTEFLSRVAACGVQVFIESHSEHILNALRVVSLNDDIAIKHDDISVLYFQDNDEEPFVSIPIDEKGGIDNWPSGFFDQTDKDFKILFGF